MVFIKNSTVKIREKWKKKRESERETNHEAFIPLFDLIFGEARILLQEIKIFFGELRL